MDDDVDVFLEKKGKERETHLPSFFALENSASYRWFPTAVFFALDILSIDILIQLNNSTDNKGI